MYVRLVEAGLRTLDPNDGSGLPVVPIQYREEVRIIVEQNQAEREAAGQ